jgi:ParB-like chromosome segregation protein Spo0J
MKLIELEKIRTDGGTQMRVSINNDVVIEYRDQWKSGVEFAPIDVFHDGAEYWVADGFHRFYGAREAKRKDIPAIVRQGTVRDAILFACGANSKHGMRRTNADKRHSVMTLLMDEEWSKWSSRVIAEKCGVSDKFVGEIRNQVRTVRTTENSPGNEKNNGSPAVVIGRNGKPQRSRKRKRKPIKQPDPLPPSKPPRSGQQKADLRLWAQFDDCYGKLIRTVDDLHRSFPSKAHHKRAVDALSQALKAIEEWKGAPA